MPNKQSLLLHEEIMLLALKDEKGTLGFESKVHFAIGGAILAELLLNERVRLDESKKKAMVEVVSSKRLGDALLDECLTRVRDSKKRATPATWVSRFSGVKRIRHRVAERLCERRILRRAEGRVLRVFKRTTYPELDPKPERNIVARLRKAIFTEGRVSDPRTIILLALANATDLLPMVFERKDLRARKKRIKAVVNGEVSAKAAAEVIESMQAAMVVIMAGAVVVTSGN